MTPEPKKENKSRIISVSLTGENLDAIKNLKRAGFAGTSEIVRAGIRFLTEEYKQGDLLRGDVEGVLITLSKERGSEEINCISHTFSDIVKTQLHTHLANRKCLQIFIIRGKGKRVRQLIENIKKNRMIDHVRFLSY